MEIIFEHPLNERVRNWLRLEEMCLRLRVLAGRESRIDHMYALTTLFDIVELMSRVDLKSDMLQELERQRQFWLAQDSNPMVSQEALQGFVTSIERIAAGLREMIGKPGNHLRDIEWLMTVKQRSIIPGSFCEFELPYFRIWLDKEGAERVRDIENWFAPVVCLQEAAQWLLRLLRDSSQAETLRAEGGQFQRSVLSARPPQLVRIGLEAQLSLVPEVSANRYQIGLRFFKLNINQRLLISEPVNFTLQQCVL